MSDAWQYQLRTYLPDELVEAARFRPSDPALGQLSQILEMHSATMKCQFDAFADYVAEAEREGTTEYPLYEWTKATIEDPAKRQKHLKSFALHVRGREVYSKDEADSLEADLQPLVGGVITRISKHDTDPEHNPQMPERYRKQRAGEFIHPTAVLHGAITLGRGASVWCHAVLRAEMHEIVVGERSNIQDHVMVHVGYKTPTIVGRYCSITHHVTLHGCRIHDNVLVGIGATVMDSAEIGANSIVAPHACVTEGTVIPPNSIVMGTPGRVTRTHDSFVANRLNAFLYWRNAQGYAAGDERLWSRNELQAELRAEEERLASLGPDHPERRSSLS